MIQSLSYLIIIGFLLLSCNPSINTTLKAPSVLQIGEAVMIDEGKFIGPCEPTISISKTNTDIIVAGAILDRVYRSEDGGQSWIKNKMQSEYGVYGDPVVRSDFNGNFYYAHLSNPDGRPFVDTSFLDRIVIQKSIDSGLSWNGGSFTLPRSPKDQDKQWLAVDPNDNTVYITWTEFDLYSSKKPEDKSRILFSKSVDEGQSWSYPIVLSQKEGDCIDSDQTTEGVVPSVGPQGQIYAAWSYDEKIYFDKSYDKGETWLENDIVVADQPEGWDFSIPGLQRCNGMPITAVDRSSSTYNGTIYVNWSDQRNGTDNTDIWLSKSSDEGDSWTKPIKVNNDSGSKHQFLTWMALDQTTGYIYIVFYDRRHHEDNTTDVYLARSVDGGATFDNQKINKTSFLPNEYTFFGDYNDISAHDGKIRPIWTQLDMKGLSIWTSIIDESTTTKK